MNLELLDEILDSAARGSIISSRRRIFSSNIERVSYEGALSQLVKDGYMSQTKDTPFVVFGEYQITAAGRDFMRKGGYAGEQQRILEEGAKESSLARRETLHMWIAVAGLVISIVSLIVAVIAIFAAT